MTKKEKKKKGPEKTYRDQKLTKKKKKKTCLKAHSLVYYCLGFENVLECESMVRIKPL